MSQALMTLDALAQLACALPEAQELASMNPRYATLVRIAWMHASISEVYASLHVANRGHTAERLGDLCLAAGEMRTHLQGRHVPIADAADDGARDDDVVSLLFSMHALLDDATRIIRQRGIDFISTSLVIRRLTLLVEAAQRLAKRWGIDLDAAILHLLHCRKDSYGLL